MATEPDTPRRKTRTRQHIIADLGVNFVERVILLAGFTAERVRYDYGYDLLMSTFSPAGAVEAGFIPIQVKAVEHCKAHTDGRTFPIRIEAADIRLWLMEWPMVILAVYDATEERAYWVEVQNYAASNELDDDLEGETVTIRVPVDSGLDVPAFLSIREWKQQAGEPGDDQVPQS